MGRTFLVTGGSGFLGRALISALLDRGDQVVAITHNSNRIDLRCIVVRMDLTDPHALSELPDLDYQACFHFAGGSSVPHSWKDPIEDFEKGLPTTLTLIHFLAQHHPSCKLLVSSSAAVYGNPKAYPVNECAEIAPISPYGIHKAAIELLCEHYSRLLYLQITVMRIFSAYGRGLRKQLLWDTAQKLQNASLDGKTTIFMSGTGAESRDFIHLSDVAQAALCLADSSIPGNLNFVNIASGKETQVRHVVNLLCQFWGDDMKPVFTGESRAGDPQRWLADTSQLAALGIDLRIKLEDGVSDYANWAKSIFYEQHQ